MSALLKCRAGKLLLCRCLCRMHTVPVPVIFPLLWQFLSLLVSVLLVLPLKAVWTLWVLSRLCEGLSRHDTEVWGKWPSFLSTSQRVSSAQSLKPNIAILMSVMPPKAEVARRRRHFRFVPLAEVPPAARDFRFRGLIGHQNSIFAFRFYVDGTCRLVDKNKGHLSQSSVSCLEWSSHRLDSTQKL